MQSRARSVRSKPATNWAPTLRLGAVASVAAAALAVIAYVLTPLPAAAIVVVLGLAAFAVSWHASATRARDAAVLAGPGTAAHGRRRRRRIPRPAGPPTGGLTV